MGFPVIRNIRALYVIKVAKWMNLVMPIIVLFYNSNGLTMQDIFILQSIYSITLMTLEIPTGYFADTVGRKTSILLGSALGFSGYLMYSLSFGFWQFVIAEILLGVSQSLVSGADSAMLYDTLATTRKEGRYSRIEGRITSIGNFGEAFAGIIGGLIALISLRMPFIVQTGIAFIALPAAIMLTEPPLKVKRIKPKLAEIISIVKTVVYKDPKLKWNTIFSSITGTTTLSMAWFAQPYFKEINLPENWFGVAWAFLNLVVGMAALNAWRTERRLGIPSTVKLFTITLFLSFVIISVVPFYIGIVCLTAFYIARGMATPLLRNYINIISSSETRATVLSVRNFLIRGLFSILGPFFGYITDAHGIRTAMLFAGVSLGSMALLSMALFLRHKTYIKTNE